MKDKDLLNSLSNFYQTYLAVQGGFINPADARYYVKDFPVTFKRHHYELQEKYKDNALIQAIKIYQPEGSPYPHLYINTVGMQDSDKRRLRSAWIDLHKLDPALSLQLVWYNIFRGGIGYNPKTFMSLVPEYVKERLVVSWPEGRLAKYPNGVIASYKDIYRHIPEVAPEVVLDLFIRNNCDEYKLVPYRSIKAASYKFTRDGKLLVVTKKDKENLDDTPYFRTYTKTTGPQLWKYEETDSSGNWVYKQVPMLGDNGRYIDMVEEKNAKPEKIDETVPKDEKKKEFSPSEDAMSESPNRRRFVSRAMHKGLDKIADLLIKYSKGLDKEISRTAALESARLVKEDIEENNKKGKLGQYMGWLKKVLESEGVKVDEEKAQEWFNNMC